MLYSYDVFDTIITRITDNPIGVFILLEEWVINKYGKETCCGSNFATTRRDAEKYAYKLYGSKTNISLIYEIISRMNGMDATMMQSIMQAEIDIEYQCSIPIGKTIEEIQGLIGEGERVVIISDMYLPSECIRKLLVKHNTVFENIPIYVSNEIGATKNEGLIYKYVREKENVKYNEWIHCGDNERSDIRIPNLMGIKTKIVEGCKIDSVASATLKSIEKVGSVEEQIYFKMLKKRMKSTEYGIGFCQSGPILYDYVRWILDMCGKLKKNRLFFIARDGYVLKKVADIVIEAKDLDISTSYIYGSRKAWRVETESDRKLVKEYINQELCDDYDEFAFVDMQGTGISCDYVADIIGCNFTVFVYYLIAGNVEPKCTTYIYSYNSDSINIMECLCRAPHGTTRGYKAEGKIVSPILEDEGNTKKEYQHINKYTEGICDFVTGICEIENALGINLDFSSISNILRKKMNSSPNKETADFLGDIIHSHNNACGKLFAPVVDEKEIVLIANDLNKYKGSSLNTSLLRSGENVKRMYNELRTELICSEPKRKKVNCRYKVILYGAGKIGRQLYIKYNASEDIEIVSWVDINYDELANEGIPVENPLVMRDLDKYDFVVIGIESDIGVMEQYLVEAGVPIEKIISDECLLYLLSK